MRNGRTNADRHEHPQALSAILLAVFLAVVMVGCGSNGADETHPNNAPNLYQLRAEIRGEPPAERTWVEGNVEHIAAISEGEDYYLYHPVHVWLLEDGNIYVWDGGDFRIKAFNPDGRFLRSYFDGQGEGPGQGNVYKSLGLWSDSLYALDPQLRRLSLFDRNGAFIRVQQYDGPVTDVQFASDSTTYEMYRGPQTTGHVTVTVPSGQVTTVSGLQEGLDAPSIALDGYLHPAAGRAVYIPSYYPVLIAFTPGDSLASAYPTPDYGEVPPPEARSEGDGFSQVIRPPRDRVNFQSTTYRNFLAVQIRDTVDSLAFDVYDTRTMDYKHSVRLPIPVAFAAYAYEIGLLAARRDTTVDVYRVDGLLEK